MDSFDDFVGNKKTIEFVKMLIHPAEDQDGARIPDMLFLGPPGHGKTSLARLLATHIGRKCIEINATQLTDPFQLRNNIAGPGAPTKEGAIIFIDECHALKKKFQINLLSATEKPRILCTSDRKEIYKDMIPDNFSFIFATTRRSYILKELTSRLRVVEFTHYSLDEKLQIAISTFKQLKIPRDQIKPEFIVDIAKRARSARGIVQFCEDIARNMKKQSVGLSKEIIRDTFNILGIDANGLTKNDRKLLGYLNKCRSPVGLETLSDILEMPKKDVKFEVEPFLLRENFMMRRSTGRAITEKGAAAIDRK